MGEPIGELAGVRIVQQLPDGDWGGLGGGRRLVGRWRRTRGGAAVAWRTMVATSSQEQGTCEPEEDRFT